MNSRNDNATGQGGEALKHTALNSPNSITPEHSTGEQLSFLPPPEFNPKFPSRDTLPGKTLARLLAGERLTQPSFGLHCWRLSAYIKALRYLDWPIEARDVQCPAGFGAGRPIREYWLPAKVIHAVTGVKHG
jgi:hypothetical protein